jgi:hypothetical protein
MRFELVTEEQKAVGETPTYAFHIDGDDCYDDDSNFDEEQFTMCVDNFDEIINELNPRCTSMLIRVSNLGWRRESGQRIIDSASGQAIRRSFAGDYSLCYGKGVELIPNNPKSIILTCTLYEHDTPTGAPIEIWPKAAVLARLKQLIAALLPENRSFLLVDDMMEPSGKDRYCLQHYGHCWHPYKLDMDEVLSEDNDDLGDEDAVLQEDLWELLPMEDLIAFISYLEGRKKRDPEEENYG